MNATEYLQSISYVRAAREVRLRRRIDSLLAQRAAKERRILELEAMLRWWIGVEES